MKLIDVIIIGLYPLSKVTEDVMFVYSASNIYISREIRRYLNQLSEIK